MNSIEFRTVYGSLGRSLLELPGHAGSDLYSSDGTVLVKS